MLGQVTKLLFMPYSSLGKTILGAKPFTGNAALFTLLVVVTYLNRKFLWGLAIAAIILKLYRLLNYYAFFNYVESSNIYNQDYWVFFYHVGNLSGYWLSFPGDVLFSNNPVSAAFLTTLYVYWLVECWKLLRAKPPGAAPAPGGP